MAKKIILEFDEEEAEEIFEILQELLGNNGSQERKNDEEEE